MAAEKYIVGSENKEEYFLQNKQESRDLAYSYALFLSVTERMQQYKRVAENISATNFKRLQSLTARLEAIEKALAGLQSLPDQTNYKHFSRKDLEALEETPVFSAFSQSPAESVIALFQTSRTPDSRLAGCDKLPPLHVFDVHRKDGVTSAKLYSNPEFFLEQWVDSAKKQVRKTTEKPVAKTDKHREKTDISKLELAKETVIKQPVTKDKKIEPKNVLEEEPPRLSLPVLAPEVPSLPSEKEVEEMPELPTDMPGADAHDKKEETQEAVLETESKEQETGEEKLDVPEIGKSPEEPKQLSVSAVSAAIEETKEEQQERQAAMSDLLSQIVGQKKKQKQVDTVYSKGSAPDDGLLAAISNVNRNKLRKVETKVGVTVSANKEEEKGAAGGIFDVLALRSALHEESEEDDMVEDEDEWA